MIICRNDFNAKVEECIPRSYCRCLHCQVHSKMGFAHYLLAGKLWGLFVTNYICSSGRLERMRVRTEIFLQWNRTCKRTHFTKRSTKIIPDFQTTSLIWSLHDKWYCPKASSAYVTATFTIISSAMIFYVTINEGFSPSLFVRATLKSTSLCRLKQATGHFKKSCTDVWKENEKRGRGINSR